MSSGFGVGHLLIKVVDPRRQLPNQRHFGRHLTSKNIASIYL
jgi:hypothetical protein